MKVQDIFQEYELPLFILLALALSWWTVPFMQGGMFPYGPSLAAVIVIAVTTGKEGLRGYWRRITNWHAGGWYHAGAAIRVSFFSNPAFNPSPIEAGKPGFSVNAACPPPAPVAAPRLLHAA